MHFSRRGVVSGLLAAAVCGSADGGPLRQKAVTDPGTFWQMWGPARTNYIADSAVEGGAAQRVAVGTKPPDPWDVGGSVIINKPVQKRDALLLNFWARATILPPSSSMCLLKVHFFEKSSGAVISSDSTIVVGAKWKPYFVSERITKDYTPGQIEAGVMLGASEQTIDFGRVTVFDFGPNADLFSLPRN